MTNELVPAAPEKPAEPPRKEVDLQPIVNAIAPELPRLIDRFMAGTDAGHRRSVWVAVALLAALTALAGIALWTGARDTAEKIVIALVSFLGGTALFGQGSK